MISPHDIAKGNFRADKFTVGSRGERPAAAAFLFGNSGLPVSHVITNGPLPFLISEPGILTFLVQGSEIALTLQVDVLKPQSRRPTFQISNRHRITLSLLKSDRSNHRVLPQIPTIDLFAIKRNDRIS